MTTMRKRKTSGKSKASKIRKLITEGTLTPAEIATKVKVSINYVYIIKGQMKQEGFVRAFPTSDPTVMPVPTSSDAPDHPKKRIEPKLESLSTPLPYIPSKPQNPFGIEATPPVGLWNMFIDKVRRWLAK